ncbi:transcription antitermination factor NusB [Alicyclobacillus dauci]|uniref:Transcription antitermination protein NusB n=1 Tax=Alicyclobacillus dauci TaxID=1475485 RepID=A0ABY6Z8W2_9BACL|nr:transcription antitermination factor NusB [Alicyclobacillus dauci]WAH39007.1 transcription antitermination factor NusB [Alicyclobacillus dauci]
MTRHEARQCALQALYQIDISDSEVPDAIAFVLEDKTVSDRDLEYVRSLVVGTRNHLIELDEQLEKIMERWSTERVGRVELNVLRLATYELLYDATMPAASILDEAVRLAKGYATEQSGKFVNGVLAKMLPVVRPDEAVKPGAGGKTEEE